MQPSPGWEVTPKRHDYNALFMEEIKPHPIGYYNGRHNCNAADKHSDATDVNHVKLYPRDLRDYFDLKEARILN